MDRDSRGVGGDSRDVESETGGFIDNRCDAGPGASGAPPVSCLSFGEVYCRFEEVPGMESHDSGEAADTKSSKSEKESAYLLGSEAMRQRLLEAMRRTEGIPLEEVRKKLGL